MRDSPFAVISHFRTSRVGAERYCVRKLLNDNARARAPETCDTRSARCHHPRCESSVGSIPSATRPPSLPHRVHFRRHRCRRTAAAAEWQPRLGQPQSVHTQPHFIYVDDVAPRHAVRFAAHVRAIRVIKFCACVQFARPSPNDKLHSFTGSCWEIRGERRRSAILSIRQIDLPVQRLTAVRPLSVISCLVNNFLAIMHSVEKS